MCGDREMTAPPLMERRQSIAAVATVTLWAAHTHTCTCTKCVQGRPAALDGAHPVPVVDILPSPTFASLEIDS